jgi:HSP20 family molecular chaperone IbpA
MTEKAKNLPIKESESTDVVEKTRSARIYKPNVDIVERDGDIVLTADMPGVDEKSVDINLEKNILSIYGKVDLSTPDDVRLVYSEYGIGDYQRSFTLSGEIDKDKIKATLKNGVLKLILPKAEPLKAKKITVEAGE